MATWYITVDRKVPQSFPGPSWRGIADRVVPGHTLDVEPMIGPSGGDAHARWDAIRSLPEPLLRTGVANTFRVDLPDTPLIRAVMRGLQAFGLFEYAWPAQRPGVWTVGPPNAVQEPPRNRFERSGGGVGLVEALAKGANAQLDGDDVTVWVVERGRAPKHPDLPKLDTAWPAPNVERQHGTRVFGVLSMLENTEGSLGLAPKARVRLASSARGPSAKVDNATVADAIDAAAERAKPGDVLLVEEACSGPGSSNADLPIECALECQTAITAATARGLIVIEPAGNGGTSLDDWADEHGRQRLHRGDEHSFVDSGAIIVGRAYWNDVDGKGRRWVADVNARGARVDCAAQGQSVYTTDNPDGYTYDFGGTSASAPIVAGIAAIVSGEAKRRGITLTSKAFRKMLRQPGATIPVEGDPAYVGAGIPDVEGLLALLG